MKTARAKTSCDTSRHPPLTMSKTGNVPCGALFQMLTSCWHMTV